MAKELPENLVEEVLLKVRAARAELGEDAPASMTIIDSAEPLRPRV